ncbi:MAG: hypothetical protein F6K09_29005, partial [Merismopedia sp. SIO2A8]|nr:hypothetical protein [Merismopedia sp. SIO2A8]
MKLKYLLFGVLIVLCTTGLLGTNTAWAEGIAPGAPGVSSVWSYAGKQGIGTSYEEYVDSNVPTQRKPHEPLWSTLEIPEVMEHDEQNCNGTQAVKED